MSDSKCMLMDDDLQWRPQLHISPWRDAILGLSDTHCHWKEAPCGYSIRAPCGVIFPSQIPWVGDPKEYTIELSWNPTKWRHFEMFTLWVYRENQGLINRRQEKVDQSNRVIINLFNIEIDWTFSKLNQRDLPTQTNDGSENGGETYISHDIRRWPM